MNSSDNEWRSTCLRILEFFSTSWGGKRHIIVPTDGNTISEPFWQLLDAFDPDYVYSYSKTLADLKISNPERYEQMLSEQAERFERENPGSDPAFVRQYIDENLIKSATDSFAISPELQEQLKSRVAPLYFEEHVVQGWVGAISEAFHPLTNVKTLIPTCDCPKEVTEVQADLPDVPTLWHAAITGRFKPSYANELRSAGIDIKEQSYASNDFMELCRIALAHPSGVVWPFDFSMLQLSEYTLGRPTEAREAVIVVVGDALEDFCLYQCLSRVRYGVCWLPLLWLENFGTRAARTNTGGRLEGPDYYSFFFADEVRKLMRLRSNNGRMHLISASLDVTKLEENRALLNQASSLGGSRIVGSSEICTSIGTLLNRLIRVCETGNAGKPKVQHLVKREIAGFFETPKPKNFTAINPFEHRWMAEFTVKGYQLPRHPSLGTYVVRSGVLTSQETRVGTNGPAYCCPNMLLINSADVDQVLIKPNVFLPDALEIANHIARQSGLSCKISDKGHFLRESIDKFGGVEALGDFLRSYGKIAVLNKYLDQARAAPGSTDDGVYLTSDHRRYLNFEAMQKAMQSSQEEVAKLIDELIQRSVVYRGFVFKCLFCRNADWFSVDEIGHDFRCKRCGRSQVYVSEHWRAPKEPSWYYKLDEIVYQGHVNNMIVPALALHYLNRTKRERFLYSSELEIIDESSGELIAEIDLFCVHDGILSVGEAKRENRLGENASDETRVCTSYLELGKRLGAVNVFFATLACQWSERTQACIRQTFEGTGFRYTLLTGPQLL